MRGRTKYGDEIRGVPPSQICGEFPLRRAKATSVAQLSPSASNIYIFHDEIASTAPVPRRSQSPRTNLSRQTSIGGRAGQGGAGPRRPRALRAHLQTGFQGMINKEKIYCVQSSYRPKGLRVQATDTRGAKAVGWVTSRERQYRVGRRWVWTSQAASRSKL